MLSRPLAGCLARAAAPRLLQRQPPALVWARSVAATDSFRYESRDEERLVKTTLHELGSQGEDMKLSLKVYNFQELSRTSLGDVVLSRDTRYQTLKQELRSSVDELSPAQLVAAMVSSARLRIQDKSFWWDFARGVERHTVKTKSGSPGLHFSQMALVLHALGKSGVKIKDRFYYRTLKLMLHCPSIWTEYDMAWILGAMRRRRLRPVNEETKEHQLWAQVQSNISANLTQKCHLFSPQGIAIILYEFARIDLFPGKVVWKAVKRIRQYLPSLSDRALVATAVTLAKYDWPEKRLLKRLSAEIREPHRFVRMHPDMLVVVLHSYAKLLVRDVPFLQAVTGLLSRSCDQLSPRSCSMAAYSLGRLGVRGGVWQPLAARIRERIERHSPLNLALIAHGFGKVSARDDDGLLEGPLADAAVDVITGFTPKHLVILLDGLTLAGIYREDLFRLALDEYIRLGSVGAQKRHQMLARIVFSAALEHPTLLAGAPPAWQTVLGRAKFVKPHAPERPYHGELALCAYALSVTGQTQKRKGPYVVDLYVPMPDAENQAEGDGLAALAVHLVADAETCPLTGEYLGPTRLRQRHLARMGWFYIGLGRREWLELPDTGARIDALEAQLRRHLPTRRRGLPQLPAHAGEATADGGDEAAEAIRALEETKLLG
mmetsp:Transcript_175219/g.561951  ORF Transcript_175219/g.561951 Transcript_175219/m.561951 type:complete len:660 (+) Transcript_175219:103-2082(+)